MSVPSQQIAAVRAFNRDYTRRIGLLGRSMLGSPYSLTAARVLYEIAHHPGVTATVLAETLSLDGGYLSRLLKGFDSRGLVLRKRAAGDGRQQHLKLTEAGRRAFLPLERRSQAQVRGMLARLDATRRSALIAAMTTIHETLEPPVAQQLRLRDPVPGDLGWVVARHGAIYAREFGWGEGFEGLVAGIVAEFGRGAEAARERCWIAERAGQRLGCVFVVKADETTAKLRLLLVETEARGTGLGRRLVSECVQFARSAGYQRMTLWTHQNLLAARRLYEEAGFRCVAAEARHSFGQDVVSETWDLTL